MAIYCRLCLEPFAKGTPLTAYEHTMCRETAMGPNDKTDHKDRNRNAPSRTTDESPGYERFENTSAGEYDEQNIDSGVWGSDD